MPIDFPTVKYGDPTAFPPSTPAATDTVMARTSAGGDRNFALGNLAGIAPVAVANDQALVYTGGAWASYSLTAGGRALSAVAGTANTFPYFSAANVVSLAPITATGRSVAGASDAAAARGAIGAADDTNVVHRTGAESVAGEKTYTDISRWTLGTAGTIEYGTPAGVPGIVGRSGDPAGGIANQFRNDFRFGSGFIQLLNASSAGTAAGVRGVQWDANYYPVQSNAMSLGRSGNVWTQVFATNPTISTSDARLKTEPRQLREAEFKAFSAVCRLPPVWRWLSRVHGDENCEPEGRAARKHFGPTVQAAMQVFADNGLDAFENAPFCYDQWEAQPEQWHEWPAKEAVLDDDGNVLEPAVEAGRELIQPAREAGDRYSFRKEELLCGMVSALARENDEQAAKIEAQQALLDDLLARVTALEAKA